MSFISRNQCHHRFVGLAAVTLLASSLLSLAVPALAQSDRRDSPVTAGDPFGPMDQKEARRLVDEMLQVSEWLLRDFDLGSPLAREFHLSRLQRARAAWATATDEDVASLGANMGEQLRVTHAALAIQVADAYQAALPDAAGVAPSGKGTSWTGGSALAKSGSFPAVHGSVPDYPFVTVADAAVAFIENVGNSVNVAAALSNQNLTDLLEFPVCDGTLSDGRSQRMPASQYMSATISFQVLTLFNDLLNDVCGGASVDVVLVSAGYNCDICCILFDLAHGILRTFHEAAFACEELKDSAEIEGANHFAQAAYAGVQHLHGELNEEARFTDDTELSALQTALTIETNQNSDRLDDGSRFTSDAERTALQSALKTEIDQNQTRLDDGSRFTSDAERTALQNVLQDDHDATQSLLIQHDNDLGTHDGDIKALLADIDADIDAHDANIDADLAAHHANIDGDLASHDANIDADLAAHDADIKADVSAHDANIDGDLVAHDVFMDEQHQEILRRLGVSGRNLVELALTGNKLPAVFAVPAGPGLDPAALGDGTCTGLAGAGAPAVHPDGLFEVVRCIAAGNIALVDSLGYPTNAAQNHFDDGEDDLVDTPPDYRRAVKNYAEAVQALMNSNSPPN